MDLDTLRRKALAARTFHVDVAPGVRIALCVPTKLESTVLYTRVSLHAGGLDHAAQIRWQRAMLLAAIMGWQGVQCAHVLSDLAEESERAQPLDFEPAAVELLLDAQGGWEQQLSAALMEQIRQRQAVEDAAEKN